MKATSTVNMPQRRKSTASALSRQTPAAAVSTAKRANNSTSLSKENSFQQFHENSKVIGKPRASLPSSTQSKMRASVTNNAAKRGVSNSIEMRGPNYTKKSTEEIKSRIRKEFGVEVNLNMQSFKEGSSTTFKSSFAKPKQMPFSTITNQKSEHTLSKDKSSTRLLTESKSRRDICPNLGHNQTEYQTQPLT